MKYTKGAWRAKNNGYQFDILDNDGRKGKEVTLIPKGSPITCQECKSSGGTLIKIPDTLPQEYRHQDKVKCSMMKLRKEVT